MSGVVHIRSAPISAAMSIAENRRARFDYHLEER